MTDYTDEELYHAAEFLHEAICPHIPPAELIEFVRMFIKELPQPTIGRALDEALKHTAVVNYTIINLEDD